MLSRKTNKIWVIVGILISIVVIYILSRHTNFISNMLIRSGPLAPIIAIILYPLLAPTPITTDPITIIIVSTYGPLIAIIISWIGNTLSALVEYEMGSKISKTANFENDREKMPFGLGKLPVSSVYFLIFGRMIPGYGSKIIGILAGSYKVPIKRYLWTSALTNLLGSILLAYGGFGLINLLKS